MATTTTTTGATDNLTNGLITSALNPTTTTNQAAAATYTPATTAVPTGTTLQTGGTVAQATNYNPATATSTGYTASLAGSTGYNPAKTTANSYEAAQAALTNWNVGDNQMVQNQLTKVLDAGSPLMTRAETKANQDMQARGLLNSSMAVKAGQSALFDYAVPIATTDAATLANAARYNAEAANANAQFNTAATNTASQFNTAAKNTADISNQNATNAAAQFKANAANTAELNNASAKNAADQYTANAANNAALANQNAMNNAAQFNAQLNTNVSMSNAENNLSLVKQNLDQQFQGSMNDANNKLKLSLQEMQNTNSQFLAQIDAKYKVEMQNNASMANVIQQYQKNVSDIMSNQNLIDAGGTAMQDALNLQQQIASDQLNALKTMTSQTVTNLTNFNPAPAPTSTAKTTAQIRADVSGMYQSILGRAPDAGGLAYWQQAVDSGQMTLEQVKQSLYDSQEFKNLTQGKTATGEKAWDGAAYLRANPDVAAAGVDPLQHYQMYGKAEGRTW